MARAFIASVPLALALVAAVVVPVAVTPGTFGFDKWPSATREQIAATPLRVAPRKVQVAVREPERRAVRTATATLRVSSNVAARPHVRLVALAPAAPHRLAATPTHSPAPTPAHQHSAGPGTPPQPVSTPAAQAPAPTVPAPTAPAPAPVQVASSGTQPALRDDTQETTDPAPAPDHHGSPARGPVAVVTHALPAPVRNIVGGHGRSNEHGERGHEGQHGQGRDSSSGHHGD